MQGYASRTHGAEGIHDRLQATALAFDDGRKQVAIATCDLIGLEAASARNIRKSVSDASGLNPEAIMINCSHTHGGPETGRRSYVGPPDESYLRELEGMVASAISKAVLDLKEADMLLGRGEVRIGANRRAMSEGRMVLGVDPSGPIDPEVTVLRVDHRGHTFGFLFNHSCHGTTLGGDNYLTTADYIGYARETVESVLGRGALSAYVNGAAGNINPHPRGTFELARRHGISLGAEVLKTGQAAEPVDQVDLNYSQKIVKFPLSSPPSREQLESELEELVPQYERAVSSGEHVPGIWARISWAREMLERIQANAVRDHLDAEIQALRIGPLGIVSLPGEVFVEIGLHAKEHSPLPYNMVGGYTNGNMGYIPTRTAFSEGGYEPNSHVYLIEQQYDPGIEQVAKDGVLEVLRSCAET